MVEDYRSKVKEVYPDAYTWLNPIFKTYCVYKNADSDNKIGDGCKNSWEAWESAYNRLKQEGKL